MTVGQLIRKRRQDVGWSQDALAAKVGLPRDRVSKIETDHLQIGYERMKLFASVQELGLTVEELQLARLRAERAKVDAAIENLERILDLVR